MLTVNEYVAEKESLYHSLVLFPPHDRVEHSPQGAKQSLQEDHAVGGTVCR
jgi:hypothetical protein